MPIPGIGAAAGLLSMPSLFDIRAPGVISTDFRNHSSADDWTQEDSHTPLAKGIASGGLVSSKRLFVERSVDNDWYNFIWSLAGSTLNQEALALLTYAGTKQDWTFNAGLYLRFSDDSHFARAGFGTTTNHNQRWHETANGGSAAGGQSSFTWSTNTPYWVRARIDASATREVWYKIWADGDSEPGTWNTWTSTISNWPTAAGRPGIVFGAANSGERLFCDYYSYAMDGASAPFP